MVKKINEREKFINFQERNQKSLRKKVKNFQEKSSIYDFKFCKFTQKINKLSRKKS